MLIVICDAVTVCVAVSGAAMVLELSISTVYDAAPDTSLQSSVIAVPREKRVSFAGLSRVGAGSVLDTAVTVSVAVLVVPPYTAERVAEVEAETVLVVMVNVALVAPAATVTLDGTVAAVELSDRFTTAPPLGAAALSVTVPVEDVPPVTVTGLTAPDVSVGAFAGASNVS